ncbi:MAG: hypothetical protein U5R31_03415 [Acidimicrobiia bacterium]|nr:hypothetical protein [Acidimicrobiia bacterium]
MPTNQVPIRASHLLLGVLVDPATERARVLPAHVLDLLVGHGGDHVQHSCTVAERDPRPVDPDGRASTSASTAQPAR